MTEQEGPSLARSDLQRRAVRGAMWTGIHTVISLPLAFLVNIVIARTLGAEGYGRLAYLSTIITVASVIAGLGVKTALIQFGSKSHAAGDAASVKRYLSGAQGYRLLISGPIVAITVVSLVSLEPWLLAAALIFGVGAPALFGTAADALTIENRTDKSAQVMILSNAITQAAVLAVVLTIGTPDSVWSARVIVGGLALLAPLALVDKLYRRAVLTPKPPWALSKTFWAFAIPTGIAGIIGALASNRIEVVFLNSLANAAAIGIFSLAFGVAGHVYAPAQALIGPLMPAISGLSRVDPASLQHAFVKTSRISSSVGGLLVAGALVPLALLVPILYGDEFRSARDHVVVIGAASAVTLVSSPHQAFMFARLRGGRALAINILSLITTLGLSVALIPTIGVWGATVSCAGTMLVRASAVTLGEARALKHPILHLLKDLGPIVISIALTLLIWLQVREMSVSPILLAPLTATVGIGSHVLFTRLLRVGISRSERESIEQSIPSQLRWIARATLALMTHRA